MNPFTSPTSVGVFTRYFTVIVTTVLTVMGVMNWLTQEQIDTILGMMPSFVEALSGFITLGITVYAVVTKARSEKADAVAKEVDEKIPVADPVVIQTPKGQPDIVVPAKG